MALYRARGDVKPLRDFLIGEAFPDQVNNFPLAWGQPHIGDSYSSIFSGVIGDLGKERFG